MLTMTSLALTLWMTPAPAATKPITIGDVRLEELFARSAGDGGIFIAPPALDTSLEKEVGAAFWVLRAKALATGFPLSRWFRDTHIIYILGLLPAADKPKLLETFAYLSEHLDRGERGVFELLNGAPHPEVIARVQAIDGRVTLMKNQHKSVIRLALAKHEVEMNQRYGDERYSYHLRAVREVLKRFGLGPKDSYLGLFLGTAVWLHDIIEDTDVTFAYLKELVGMEMATTVWAVTKRRRLPFETAEWNLLMTLAKTGLFQFSRLLKLADRIANVEEGMIRLFQGQPTKVHKYIEEWPQFFAALYVEGEADEMWIHLRRLLTDQAYAHKFAMNALVRCDSLLTSPPASPRGGITDSASASVGRRENTGATNR